MSKGSKGSLPNKNTSRDDQQSSDGINDNQVLRTRSKRIIVSKRTIITRIDLKGKLKTHHLSSKKTRPPKMRGVSKSRVFWLGDGVDGQVMEERVEGKIRDREVKDGEMKEEKTESRQGLLDALKQGSKA
jgi:hypothetical protein